MVVMPQRSLFHRWKKGKEVSEQAPPDSGETSNVVCATHLRSSLNSTTSTTSVVIDTPTVRHQDPQHQPPYAPDGPPSAPPASPDSPKNLWDQAWDRLVQEEPKVAAAFAGIVVSSSYPGPAASVDPSSRRPDSLKSFIDSQVKSIEERQWRFQLGSMSIGVRDSVERIVGILSATKDLATQVAALDPMHAGLPVAAMYFVLTFLSRDKEQAESLSSGTELVARLTQRYLAVESSYLEGRLDEATQLLRTNVLSLYSQILLFQARAAIHLDGKTARRTASNMFASTSWSDQTKEISRLDSDCENQRRLIGDLYHRDCAVDFQNLLQQFQRDVLHEWRSYRRQQQTWYESERASQCMSILRTIEYEAYKNRNPNPTAGTCKWLTSHPEFQDWLATSDNAYLWMTADPGCGKSTYARYLVDEYFSKHADAGTLVCYYFFKNEAEAASPKKAICSVLHQIFRGNETSFLLHHIESAYTNNREKLASLFEELWKVFVSVVRDHCAGRIILVFDALDECSAEDRSNFIPKLVQLATEASSGNFKLLLTSRPSLILQDSLQPTSRTQATRIIRLMGENEREAQSIKGEIDVFMDAAVHDFRTTRKARRLREDNAHELVRKRLLSAENRTYLWVTLMLKRLMDYVGDPLPAIQACLQSLPATVEDAYENVLRNSRSQEYARKLLSLVIAAPEPLTPSQLYVFTYVDEQMKELSDLEPPPAEAIQSHLRDLCGVFVVFVSPNQPRGSGSGLSHAGSLSDMDSSTSTSTLEPVNGQPRVFLIHETAREFLSKPSSQQSLCCPHQGWKHCILMEDACHVYTRSCMLLLLLAVAGHTHDDGRPCDLLVADMFRDDRETGVAGLPFWALGHDLFFELGKEDPVRRLESWDSPSGSPIHYWEQTFRDAGASIRPSFDLALRICRSKCRILLALAGLRDGELKCSALDGALHASVTFDLPLLTQHILDESKDQLNWVGKGCGCSALQLSIKFDISCFDVLVSTAGVNPNIPRAFPPMSGQTVLMDAAAEGNDGVLRALLDSPLFTVDVNAQDRRGETALMKAVRSGYPSPVEVLLRRRDLDINLRDSDGNTALHLVASSYGADAKVLKILELHLQHQDIDVNVRNNHHETLLLSSFCQDTNRHVALRLLQDNRVEVNTRDIWGDTPLIAACWRARPVMVSALMKRSEIRLNAQNDGGQSALMAACSLRSMRCAELLLNGEDMKVNAQDLEDNTALLHLLFRRRFYEWNAELMKSRPKCIMVMLSRGVDPSLVSIYGPSAISLVLVQGEPALLRLFQKHDQLRALGDECIADLRSVWYEAVADILEVDTESLDECGDTDSEAFETEDKESLDEGRDANSVAFETEDDESLDESRDTDSTATDVPKEDKERPAENSDADGAAVVYQPFNALVWQYVVRHLEHAESLEVTPLAEYHRRRRKRSSSWPRQAPRRTKEFIMAGWKPAPRD